MPDRWWRPRSPLCKAWGVCSHRCVGEIHDRDVMLPKALALFEDFQKLFPEEELAPVRAARSGGEMIDAMSRLNHRHTQGLLAKYGLESAA